MRDNLQSSVDALLAAARRGEPAEARRRLREIVPEYEPVGSEQKTVNSVPWTVRSRQ